jgi:hypothetical protein
VIEVKLIAVRIVESGAAQNRKSEHGGSINKVKRDEPTIGITNERTVSGNAA